MECSNSLYIGDVIYKIKFGQVVEIHAAASKQEPPLSNTFNIARAHELVVGHDMEEQVGRSLAAVQFDVGVIEGFPRSILSRGDHELLSLHFAARALLATGILTCGHRPRENLLPTTLNLSTFF